MGNNKSCSSVIGIRTRRYRYLTEMEIILKIMEIAPHLVDRKLKPEERQADPEPIIPPVYCVALNLWVPLVTEITTFTKE